MFAKNLKARLKAGAAPILRRMSGTRTDGIVVMKFGGTSVAGTEELKRAARRIVAARDQGKQVVAVLSARGRTTDRLL